MHVIKKHRNNLLFNYYELGFRRFELNLFSQCFDSVRFEKFKPEQALRRGGRNRIGRREKWPKQSWKEGEIGGKSREEGEKDT